VFPGFSCRHAFLHHNCQQKKGSSWILYRQQKVARAPHGGRSALAAGVVRWWGGPSGLPPCRSVLVAASAQAASPLTLAEDPHRGGSPLVVACKSVAHLVEAHC
jgi:hypothetical protein